MASVIAIMPTVLSGHARIRSGTADRPVTQSEDRQFTIIHDPAVDFGSGPQPE